MGEVTALLPSRRRVEAFARAVEGEPAPADVLALARLVALLEQVPTSRIVEPDAEFRTGLRERLVSEAAATTAKRPRQGPGSAAGGAAQKHPLRRVAARRRAVAVAAAAALGLGLGGTGVASASALPGDTLYGMKRATESLRLAVAGSDLERGRLELSFAGRRLGEVEQVLRRPLGLAATPRHPVAAGLSDADGEQLAGTLADWESSAHQGARLLFGVHEQTGEAKPLTELDAFARDQGRRLRAVLPSLPPELRAQAHQALTFTDDLRRRSVRLLEEASDPPATPPAASCADEGDCTPAAHPTSPQSGPSGDDDGPSPGSDGSDPTAGATGRASGGADSGTSGVGGTDLPTENPAPHGSSGLQDTVDKLGDTLGDTVDDTTSGVGDTVGTTTKRLGSTVDQTTESLGGTLDGTTTNLTDGLLGSDGSTP